MRISAGSVVAGAATKITLLEPAALWGADRTVAPSDRVRFAAIGTGTRGCELLAASLAIPGIRVLSRCAISMTAGTRRRRRRCRSRFRRRVLSGDPGPQRCGRGDCGRCDHQHRRVVVEGVRGGQGCVLRKADVAYGGRRLSLMVDAVRREIASCRWVASAWSSIVYEKKRAALCLRSARRCVLHRRLRRTATRRAARGDPIPPNASEQDH